MSDRLFGLGFEFREGSSYESAHGVLWLELYLEYFIKTVASIDQPNSIL